MIIFYLNYYHLNKNNKKKYLKKIKIVSFD